MAIAGAVFAGTLLAAAWGWSEDWGSFRSREQKEVRIDDLNTTASMKSWVVCGFAEGFDWPASAKTGAFRVGVLGDNDLLKFLLNNCHLNQYGNQLVEVSEAPAVPDGAMYHILCVGDVESAAWKGWKKEVAQSPTLVVTQEEGGIPDLAVVNFHFESGMMRLQIDAERAAKLQISIGNELKSWVQ